MALIGIDVEFDELEEIEAELESTEIEVELEAAEIEVELDGPMGPPGPKGDAGTNGVLHFEAMSYSSGTTWVIAHAALGAVLIIDQGTVQRPGVDYTQTGQNFTFNYTPIQPYAYYPY